ncbi:MAG: SLBB domain-containing protein [Deferribacteres bacterium]|nr:SLBB domain-containing protein [candidate division KSB1 bacterium]MCB9509841.1 SLBB domain-containing protein [Deferribacteres bacterium]
MSHRIASTLFVLLLAFGQTTLLSQDVRERLPERTIPDERQELQTVALKSQALEGAIDPETYLVGPGDAFNIELEGLRQYNSVVTVSPEGKLIIPTLGVYDVQGKSVTEVRRLVAEKARSKFVGGQIKINLVGVRDIRVHVTGQVAQPGTYQAKSVYRISDVITLAGGLNSWANARSIELRRENQPTQVIDYYAFMTEGELSQNVLVDGGDVVYVPSVYGSENTVHLEGRVQNSGLHAIHAGETAERFLFRINALQQNSDLSRAQVVRRAELTGEEQIFSIFSEDGDNGKSITLQQGDIIRVPAVQDSVYVQGDCLRPGPYPYQPGWRSRDYAGLAGAKETAVSPKGFQVLRSRNNQKLKGADVPVERGDTIIIPSTTRRKIGEYISIVAQLASISYFIIIIRQEVNK